MYRNEAVSGGGSGQYVLRIEDLFHETHHAVSDEAVADFRDAFAARERRLGKEVPAVNELRLAELKVLTPSQSSRTYNRITERERNSSMSVMRVTTPPPHAKKTRRTHVELEEAARDVAQEELAAGGGRD